MVFNDVANFVKENVFHNKNDDNDNNVSHPAHYTDGKYEVIVFIEDRNYGFHLGNAVKYISRAGKKGKNKYAEDIHKAAWYINRVLNSSIFNIHYSNRRIDINDYIQDKKLDDLCAEAIYAIDNYAFNPYDKDNIQNLKTIAKKLSEVENKQN